MATPPGGGRLSSHGRIAGTWGLPENGRQRRDSEVIDLTSPPTPASATATTTTGGFHGVALSDFSIGDRLGATRDGGEGFQGCNSRVFRATLHPRPQDQHNRSLNGNSAKRKRHQDACPASMASPFFPAAAASGSGAEGGHGSGTTSSMLPRGGSVIDGLKDIGERFWTGGFGTCFTGNYANVDTEVREASGSGKAGDGRVGTEWAIKMALTLVDQDPRQAERDMETEIAILVGGRIPPHANVMRGVHSFQDDIGENLQPVLWAGLGPAAGKTLSPRTFFVVMPLFKAGSLQALLNKRRTRCEGPPFLRLLDAMRFLEQMLSAVNHLLANGVAHNDIKPDNWLLRADHRTLVLTDFGACIDSRRPPTNRRHSSSSPAVSKPSAPIPDMHATPTTTGLGEAAVAPRTSSSYRPTGGGGGASAVAAATGCSDTYEGTLLASSTATPQASSNPFIAASEGRGLTGKFPPGVDADEGVDAASGARKRRRYYAGEQSDGWRIGQRGGGPARVGDEPDVRSTGLSEKLVFPFNEYFMVGAASIVAPELAQAWREKTVLDYRRSDVFSVGVCMYRMLRPDPVYIDNGTGLEGKETACPSEDRRAWPLPLFPENKGGCPDEVANLCLGLLHPDPEQRQTAEEGCSVASWLVSLLENAEEGDAKESVSLVSGPAERDTRRKGAPSAGCGDEYGKMRAVSSSRVVGGDGASATNSKGHHLFAALVDRHRDMLGRIPPSLPSGGARANQRRDQVPVLPSGDAGVDKREEGGGAAWAPSIRGAAARLESKSEERRLGGPDDLVRSDRISHMRDIFPNASPEDLFEALDTREWKVTQACAVFGGGISGGGACGGRPKVDLERTCLPGDSMEGNSAPGSRYMLWFDGVAEELRGRHRGGFPPGRRQQFPGNSGHIPSWKFGT